MRDVFKILGGTMVLLTALLLNSHIGRADPTADATPLAKVNGEAITSRDLLWEMQQLNKDMALRNRPISREQINDLRAQMIETLIEREVLYQNARQRKIGIRPQWIDEALTEFREALGGKEALQRFLTGTGHSLNELKENLGRGLAVQRLLTREVIRTIHVSQAEVQAFYRDNPDLFTHGGQIRVRHILISVDDMNDEKKKTGAWNKIQAYRMQIEQGSDFAVLALKYSDCPSKTRAGDLGYVTRDQLVPTFADAAFALSTGAVSDIVTTRFGYHLIQVLDRTQPGPVSYKDVSKKIEKKLRRDKENAAIRRYVERLKSQAEIERLVSKR